MIKGTTYINFDLLVKKNKKQSNLKFEAFMPQAASLIYYIILYKLKSHVELQSHGINQVITNTNLIIEYEGYD